MEEINWKYTSRTKTTDKVGDLDQLLFQHIFIHHHPIITIDLHIVVAGSALICWPLQKQCNVRHFYYNETGFFFV